MSSPNRKWDVWVLFWVSAAEMDVISRKWLCTAMWFSWTCQS